MAIKISNPQTEPELVYENFFMDEIRITQTPKEDHAGISDFTLVVIYRLYAVDSQGKRHYRPVIKHISIDDYLTLAMQKAQAGDPDLLNAMQSIETALAKIIEDQLPEFGTTEVT